jgi:hypothetical protein
MDIPGGIVGANGAGKDHLFQPDVRAAQRLPRGWARAGALPLGLIAAAALSIGLFSVRMQSIFFVIVTLAVA